MKSRSLVTERAKPLLGTTVSIRVHGLEETHAQAAINAGFAAVRAVHAAMSFHDASSDVSRLNRDAPSRPVAVSAGTYHVIARALAHSQRSDGAFDITIAPALVARGLLPAPDGAPRPGARASWREIVLLDANRIAFARPLWIDLSGIAKGYAVDRAMDAVMDFHPARAVINAGGDLKVRGTGHECVHLAANCGDVPVIKLADGSLASSERTDGGPHIDPRRHAREGRLFVSVMAPDCIDADALTKVVMLRGAFATSTLRDFGAHAVIHNPPHGWRQIASFAA